MSKYQVIEVRAASTDTEVLNGSCAVVREYDTIQQAKQYVKWMFRPHFQVEEELSAPIRYAQIVADGECVYDFFAKGYRGEPVAAEL